MDQRLSSRAAQATTRIPVGHQRRCTENVAVRLLWREQDPDLFEGMVLASWDDADAAVREMARQVPPGKLEKIVFAVTWESGDTYRGTYAIAREDEAPETAPLSSHVHRTIAFLAGQRPFRLPVGVYRLYIEEVRQQRPELVMLAERLVANGLIKIVETE
jgi:hypothetical protein